MRVAVIFLELKTKPNQKEKPNRYPSFKVQIIYLNILIVFRF